MHGVNFPTVVTKPSIALPVHCMKTYQRGLDAFVVYVHRIGTDENATAWFYMSFLNDRGLMEGALPRDVNRQRYQDTDVCDEIAKDAGYYINQN